MRKLLADRPLTNGRFVAVVLAAAGAAAAQETGPGLPDPFRLLEPKDFVARRASSNNPDPRVERRQQAPDPRRDDRARRPAGPRRRHPHLADVAATSTAGRGCCACASTTTAAATPSVDAPLGDFFAVGHGFERPVQLADGPRQLGRPVAQQLLADALPEVLPDHGHQRGPPPRRQPLLPRGLGEGAGAPRGHAVLPRPVPAGAPRAGRRLALRVPERARAGATTSGPCSRSSRPRPAGSARGTTSSTSTARRSPRSRARAARTTSTTPGGCTWTTGPYAGVTVAEGTGLGSRMTAYRWHLADPVPVHAARSASTSSTRAGPSTPTAR